VAARMDLDAYSGTMTALITPFRGGALDEPALRAHVARQVQAGIDWLVPTGTTGESPTLTAEERERIWTIVREQAADRCKILAGTGTNSTASTIERTRAAKEAGAEAAMLVAPYYNRPTAEGLYAHFAAVAEAVELPLVLYNVPARTGVSIPMDVVVRLREAFKHIVALKHATGSVEGVTELAERSDIAVLSGDDSLTWPLMAAGARGVVSVVSNLAPDWMKSLVEAARNHNVAEALRWHRRVDRLADGLARVGPNPMGVKTALSIVHGIEAEFRLPLCPPSKAAREDLATLLRSLELLPG
jgi:4-hydroxy-tetrahydrodipicolinate synthase